VSARDERRAVLRGLLASRSLGSQAEVAAALAEAGHPVHAATVSRDLEELGARRVRGSDGALAYRVGAPTPAPRAVDEVLRRFVVSVAWSGNLAVLRTPPACAHPVASAIDGAGMAGVLATVAGDDTVLVVAAPGSDGAAVADDLAARIGMAPIVGTIAPGDGRRDRPHGHADEASRIEDRSRT